ncbi:MAG: class I SAM-dependent methyltransferase [Thermomicrobiales bacterium]
MPRFDELVGLRFDSVAERYHRVRPRYPDEIWDTLVEAIGLRAGARVLEIGAGTGIATAELARRGVHVTALEPGAAMAAMIQRELGDTGRVEVVVERFEDWSIPQEPFDLVIGATSLHWIDRAVLQERLPALLKPDGHAALLHYLHVAGGDTAFFDAAQECYANHDPDYQEDYLRSPDDSSLRSQVLDNLTGFQPARTHTWQVEIPSDRRHYLSLISTYSTMLRIPEPNRLDLFRCIGDLMDNRFGDSITKRYRFDLVVTQRERWAT